ncbi:helix-turn-helix transcriptional regulator [Christensenellaceae bacterium OttesenSCG-928-K19]|nr:helix-turn-helix transcriptional regulator [Christensenellaceae bacterium OttesenSCG-928-K19]
MGIYYYKLFDLMNKRNLKKGQLMTQANFSNATMAKLSNHKNVEVAVIGKICSALNCQPGDIMEYIADDLMTPSTEGAVNADSAQE